MLFCRKDPSSFKGYSDYLGSIIKLVRMRRKRLNYRLREDEIEGKIIIKVANLLQQCWQNQGLVGLREHDNDYDNDGKLDCENRMNILSTNFINPCEMKRDRGKAIYTNKVAIFITKTKSISSKKFIELPSIESWPNDECKFKERSKVLTKIE
ncbi:unnamed protein product [Brugia pahangi]|uniref:Uncharacterized protein n=1 Tax=Brugia pahangi TaxID=6280 RepID=A0A0N4T2K2_BRUPA|nr:unnamed protein product [Brugia pahangi]